MIREREQQKLDTQNKKLNRKEENDFYRAIMAYGIEYGKDNKKPVWDRFKALARLEKKYDDTLNEFYLAFVAACKKACKQTLNEDEEASTLSIEAIEEAKAKKILNRIQLIKSVRKEVLSHDKLDERLLLCEPASDLPEWWIPGKHDKDLLQGVARHGMARMDYYILNDPELSFKDILQRFLCKESLLDKKAAKEYEKARDKIKAELKSSKESEESKDEAKDANEESKESKTPEKAEKAKKKARRASVSIAPPQITYQQMEQMAKGGIPYDMDMMYDLVAQTHASQVEWPKDQILAIRLEHIVKCVLIGQFPEDKGHSLGEILAQMQDADNAPFDAKSPDSNLRETPESAQEMSKGRSKAAELSVEPPQSKIRQLLTADLQPAKAHQRTEIHDDEDDPIARLTKNKGLSGVEITPVNGDTASEGSSWIADLQRKAAAKKTESALDKLPFQKRKLQESTSEDKTKKKKRLDDIMFGLGAAKGVNLDKEDKVQPGQSLLKKDATSMSKIPDLNKLQDLLGRPDSPSEAKVQKWLEAQMGVVPDRPVTPGNATATSTSSGPLGKSPKGVGNLMEWMSNLSGDEHVTVLNRFTGKKLSGTQGPKLKYLAQWLIENPMFDVDPKWAELVKNKETLKSGSMSDLAAAFGAVSGSSSGSLKRKGPGRPPLDEPAAKKQATGMGPSYSLPGLSTMAGLDPKNPMSALANLDPKNPMSLATLYGLDPKKLDPVTAAMLGFGDPKNPLKMDPMMMAAMGMDAKTLQAMGLDQKSLQAMMGMDPKMLGLDAKSLQAMGMDPKLLQQSFGMDPKMLQSLGMDPKMLAAMGLDAKTLQAMGLDQIATSSASAPSTPPPVSKAPTSSASNMFDPKMLAAFGMDAKSLQQMGLDPKMLQQMGIDAKTLQAMGLMPPAASAPEKKTSQLPTASPKASKAQSNAQADLNNSMEAMAKAMGIDPRKMDQSMLAAMGLDPKKMDPMTLAALGLDPKNPNASLMAAMAAMDPNNQLAAMYSYGLNPAMMAGIPGMEMFMGQTGSGKGKSSGSTPVSKSASSPRASPRPPSRASAKSDDRRSPRTSVPSSIAPRVSTPSSSSPRVSTPSSSALSALGLDPKLLAGMDPNLLKAAGLDPKTLASLDPKLLGLDPRSMMGFGGLDPKVLAGMDPKLLQAAGIDPKMFSGLDKIVSSASVSVASTSAATSMASNPFAGIDPKLLAGIDPKLLAGLDPKLMGLDPKLMSAMMDPKLMAGMDPKALFGGMDPRLFGFDPKMFEQPKTSKGAANLAATSVSPALDPRLFGLDPKMLQGLDAKALQSLGLDPKVVTSLLEGAKKYPPVTTTTTAKITSSVTPTFSSLETKVSTTTASGATPTSSASLDASKLYGGIDPKLLAGFDPKLLGLDAKTAAAYGLDPKMFSGGIDPKMFGLDPKMFAGLDAKTLAAYGIDPKFVEGATGSSKADKKSASASAAANPMAGLAGLDPKLLGLDPKTLAALDPKLLMDMGIDPRLLDPKAASSLASAFDPKLLASAGLDPKMFGLDPKTMASLASMDPKELAKLDPSLAALYGLPGMPSHNGVSSKSPASGSQGSKVKPGTVAAALEEKKRAAAEAAKATPSKAKSNDASETSEAKNSNNSVEPEANNSKPESIPENLEDVSEPTKQNGNDTKETPDASVANTEASDGGNEAMDSSNDTSEVKGGLTSEERVLLREKKKARLQKEQQQNDQNNDGGNSSGAEGSITDQSTDSSGTRLTRSGRRRGLGKLDAVVDKLQDTKSEDSA